MDDEKRILVFSDAGGTGRTYHADLSARNQRLRVHYLLEAGWKADTAIQGLGRTQPHQPGAAAAVPADRHRCEGREALPVDHRPPARHARRHHQGPAPDRRAGPVPRRGQSRKPLRPRRAAPALPAARSPARSKAVRCRLRGRDRPEADRSATAVTRGAAADHDLPQPAAGADHRSAEHRCSPRSRSCSGQDRGRDRVRHLRCRRGDADAPRASSVDRPADDLHPSRDRRGDAGCCTIAGASAIGRSRSRRRWTALDDPRAVLLVNSAVGPRRRAGPGAQPHARRWRGRTPRPPPPADGAHSRVRWLRWRRPTGDEADRDTFAAAWEAELAEIPDFTDSDVPHRHRPAAADLEAAAGRVHAGLPAADRRRRARHRPPGLAGLGRAVRVQRRRRRALRPTDAWSAAADGWHDHPRTCRRASACAAPR